MKTAVSVPDDIFASADALAKRLGVSRSRLYAQALSEFLAKYRGRSVTARLDRVYASQHSQLDRKTRRLQARSLPRDPW